METRMKTWAWRVESRVESGEESGVRSVQSGVDLDCKVDRRLENAEWRIYNPYITPIKPL